MPAVPSLATEHVTPVHPVPAFTPFNKFKDGISFTSFTLLLYHLCQVYRISCLTVLCGVLYNALSLSWKMGDVMGKSALITGIAGQDGAYLAELLLEKGYRVCGLDRDVSPSQLWRLRYLGVADKLELAALDMTDTAQLFATVAERKPDELYHLAAMSVPAWSKERPIGYAEVNGLGAVNLLEAVRCTSPHTRIFMASTVRMLAGGRAASVQDCHFAPDDPYAIAKLYGYAISCIYRQGYGLFVASGIMSNHESPLRGLDFVTRRISNGTARIKLGLQQVLELGNIEAVHDWGYAPDFVRAMWQMLQQDEPGDYILATGESHSVREFAQKAFALVGLDWRDYVRAGKGEASGGVEIGAAGGLPGWRPSVMFDDIVRMMVEEDLHRWQLHLQGKSFPWDIGGG